MVDAAPLLILLLLLIVVPFEVAVLAIRSRKRMVSHRRRVEHVQPQIIRTPPEYPAAEYLAPETRSALSFDEKISRIVSYALSRLQSFYPDTGKVIVEVVQHGSLRGAWGACGSQGEQPVIVISNILNPDMQSNSRELFAFKQQMRQEGAPVKSTTDVLIRVLLEEVCHAAQIYDGRTDAYQGPINQFTYAAYASSPMESEAKAFANRHFYACKQELLGR